MTIGLPIAPMGIYGYVTDVSNGIAPLAYSIGIIAMIFTALSYARMANAFPMAFLILHISVFVYFVIKQKKTDPVLLFKYCLLPLIGFLITKLK